MSAVQDRARQVAEELLGSSTSINDVTTAAEREDYEFCDALDAIVMQCELCSWWFDTDEIDTESGEALCADCKE